MPSNNPSSASRPGSSPARNSTSANNTPLQHRPQFGQSWETASVGLSGVMVKGQLTANPANYAKQFPGSVLREAEVANKLCHVILGAHEVSSSEQILQNQHVAFDCGLRLMLQASGAK
jgi:hypothetical protein